MVYITHRIQEFHHGTKKKKKLSRNLKIQCNFIMFILRLYMKMLSASQYEKKGTTHNENLLHINVVQNIVVFL